MNASAFVNRTKIIGTDTVILNAVEPLNGHTSMTTIDGVTYGYLTSRPLPRELASMPALSEMRYYAVMGWYQGLYDQALDVIARETDEYLGHVYAAHGGEIVYYANS